MATLREWLTRLRDTFRPRRPDADLEDELYLHLELAAEEEARRAGTTDGARRAAAIRIGGVAQVMEGLRDQRGLPWLDAIRQDVRHGLRSFRRSPGLTAMVVLTLALCFGANTAIFSAVDAILLRPLPFRDPGRLVDLAETEPALARAPVAPQDFLDWQDHNHTLTGMALMASPKNYNLSGAGVPRRVAGQAVEANFFSLLGARPLAGRTFRPGDDRAGANQLAVLGYGFWQRQFGGDRTVVGREIRLNGVPYSVVGIMPPPFRYPAGADLWTPLDMTAPDLHVRGQHDYRAIGRLRPGTTVAQAQADLSTLARQLGQQFPDTNAKIGVRIVALHDQLVSRSRTLLLILLGVVGLVLLIGCANVANLLLARASGRQREMALRQALGASSGRLTRQLLTESALLALAGAGTGLFVAHLSLGVLTASPLVPSTLPVAIQLDRLVLAFTLVAALLTGLFFGAVPALQMVGDMPGGALRSGERGTARDGHGRLRNLLVVAELAISLVVLAAAGLLLRSFQRLATVDVGIRTAQVCTMKLALPAGDYATPAKRTAFYDDLTERVRHLPGIDTASISSALPLQRADDGYVSIDGVEPDVSRESPVQFTEVSPAYLPTLGIPLLSGRLPVLADQRLALSAADAGGPGPVPPGGTLVPAVINHAMAEQFWASTSPLGHRFDGNKVVVGVVGDVRNWGIQRPAMPQAYLPIGSQEPDEPVNLVVKSSLSPGAVAAAVRQTVQTLDPALAIFDVRSMEDVVSESLGTPRFQTAVLGVFAALALLLALGGIYGVMTYAVSQRTREMGIRLALGAGERDVLWLVLREGGLLTLAGTAVGLAVSPMLTQLLRSLLYGVNPLDAVTFTATTVLLAATGLAATYLPARRATRVDPLVALKEE